MMVLFDYIGKMALVSGVLYAYYHWVLRDNRFHQWNRFYLLAAVFLSLTLPLFHISLARQTSTDNKLLSAVYALLDQKASGPAPVAINAGLVDRQLPVHFSLAYAGVLCQAAPPGQAQPSFPPYSTG
jgi:hypothetical protein